MLKPSSAESLYALVHDPRWRSAPPSEEDVLALLATVAEGSRVLDGIVYCCQRKLVFRRVMMEQDPILYYVDPDNGFDEGTIKFPAVTLSIDAAAGAVSADWRIGSMRYFDKDEHWVVSLAAGPRRVGRRPAARRVRHRHASLPADRDDARDSSARGSASATRANLPCPRRSPPRRTRRSRTTGPAE